MIAVRISSDSMVSMWLFISDWCLMLCRTWDHHYKVWWRLCLYSWSIWSMSSILTALGKLEVQCKWFPKCLLLFLLYCCMLLGPFLLKVLDMGILYFNFLESLCVHTYKNVWKFYSNGNTNRFQIINSFGCKIYTYKNAWKF